MMKRSISFIVALFCLLMLFCGCASNPAPAQNPTNATPPPPSAIPAIPSKPPQTTAIIAPSKTLEQPHQKELRIYNITDQIDLIGVPAIKIEYDIPGFIFDWHVDNTAPQQKTITFNGQSYTATYEQSQTVLYQTHLTDYYNSDGFTFAVNRETGALEEFINYHAEEYGKKSAKDCAKIADQLAKQYINLDDCQRTMYPNSSHIFDYIKCINGIETTEHLYVLITPAGDCAYFSYYMQNAFDEFVAPQNLENTTDHINMLTSDDAITLLENRLMNDYSGEYISHSISKNKLTVLDDGTIGIIYMVHINLDTDIPGYDDRETQYLLKYE